jgi:DNA polymerase III epsilon subunit-like protein
MLPLSQLSKQQIVDLANWRCPHRHSGLDHYHCWLAETQKAQRWCVLDLETSNLNAPFGILLCWGIKEYGKDEIYQGAITKKDLADSYLDRRLVAECVDVLGRFDTVITYYGTGFDIKWLRAKTLHFNLEFPPYGSIRHIDLYYMVKNRLKLGRSSLDNACEYLGISGKTRINWDNWLFAMTQAKPSAVADITEHNKQDLIITEKLYDRLKPYAKLVRRSI